uniref:Transmembrane protein 214-A n=1 Tax=Ciona intestinalis TaxID=7719 RepID=A0A1W3JVH5_CIOIN|nr:transmembrane protein 214-A [Ciona intestinalis]|eukprot:XP_009862478.1 transmembrane protein 214-A [Ciona intestinalis]
MSKTEDKWEVVGNVKAKTRAQKQALSKSMPKADQLPYSVTQSPMFEGVNGRAFQDVSNKKPTKSDKVSAPKSPGKQAGKRPKKPQIENKFNYQSIEDAFKDEELFLIDDKLARLKEQFPNNEMVWLKDIASYLNINITCPEDNTDLTKQEFDYPICKASSATHQTLIRVFGKEVSEKVVPLIFQYCLTKMLECIARKNQMWGYKICLQAIAHTHPALCSDDLDIQVEKLKTSASEMQRCLALVWALGQVGLKDMRCGMKVWLQLLLPNLEKKKLAPYTMYYVERIVKKTKQNPAQSLSGCLNPGQFVEITRYATGNSQIKDRMSEVFPLFRQLIIHNNAMKRQFFNHFLTMSHVNEAVMGKMVEICMECLRDDAHCFTIWREKYSSSFPSSKLLLTELHNRRPGVLTEMPRVPFEDAVRYFRNINSEAATKSDSLTSKPEFATIRNICETLCDDFTEQRQTAQQSTKSFYFYLLLSMLIICGLFVLYDVKSHGTWKKSETYHFLKKNGVLDRTHQAWIKTKVYLDVAKKFVQTKAPIYWENSKLVLGPYLVKLTETGKLCWSWIVEVAKPVVFWISLKVNDGWIVLSSWLGNAASICLLYLDQLITYCWPYLVSFSDYMFEFYHWVLQVISGEASLAVVQDTFVQFCTNVANKVNLFIQNVFEIVSNYIAPNQP